MVGGNGTCLSYLYIPTNSMFFVKTFNIDFTAMLVVIKDPSVTQYHGVSPSICDAVSPIFIMISTGTKGITTQVVGCRDV
jgi:hypothetical protein